MVRALAHLWDTVPATRLQELLEDGLLSSDMVEMCQQAFCFGGADARAQRLKPLHPTPL